MVWKGSGAIKITIFFLSAVSICLFFVPSANAISVVATITDPSLSNPWGVAYDSGKGEAFVANEFGSVSVISDATNAVVATMPPLGIVSNGVAYDSTKGEVFVATGSGSVSVISDATNAVVATIPVGFGPQRVAYDSGKGEIFVTNVGSGSVSVISDATNAVVATIPVGPQPYGIAYDSGKGEVFVTNGLSGTVSVISDSTNAVVATISGVFFASSDPIGLAYDSGKGEIFVGNVGSVSVISDATNAVVATIPVGFGSSGIAYDFDTGEVFVTNAGSNTVSVISDLTNTVVATILVGSNPEDVAYDSGKGEVFVTNVGSNSVSVLGNIIPINTPPVANNDLYSTNENTALSVSATAGVLANDNDPDGDTLTASLVSGTTQGTLTLNPDGSFTYTPNSDFIGSDSFVYQANDGHGNTALAPVAITVNQIICPAGSFLSSGSNNCTPAPPGSYVPSSGSTSATLCPAGTYCPTAGTITPLTCPAGTTSNAGATSCYTVDTTPPVLTVPSPITQIATSPAGATVTFVATATDPDDAASTPTCIPSSGSTFPIGTTTVTCSSTDTHGNTGTASFTVTIQTPAQATNSLVSTVNSMNLPNGVKSSLASTLNNINLHSPSACGKLNAFIVKVNQDLSNGSLTVTQAKALLSQANAIKAAVGCP